MESESNVSNVQSAGTSEIQDTPRLEPTILNKNIVDKGSITIGPNTKPSLNCLADVRPDERPPYTHFTLVKYAILGSPDQKLTLSEIYDAITTRFPWFQNAGNGWKNSVRHCLSLDTQFYKEPRPRSLPGKGGFWKVSVNTPRGHKRERKRSRMPSKRKIEEELQHPDVPSSFPLISPAFPDHTRDYDTTIPGSSSLPPAPQSGWLPYFPPKATNKTPLPAPVHRCVQVKRPQRQISPTPNTSRVNLFKLSPACHWGEKDDWDSETEGEEVLQQ